MVGAAHCLRQAQEVERYAIDERRLYHGRPAAVVRPADRTELATVVAHCHAARVAMVPQGGNTGYCGGATPDTSGEQVVISLERLDRVIEVDAVGFTLTVEAGVVLAQAQAAAAEHGLLLPLSMGSEASCQVGGNLATNAGGLAVLRYGTARELALGIEVVLPDGRVLSELRGLRKDNTGYDLRDLFIGAEGTLGIITAATLKLFPAAEARGTAMVALADVGAAVRLLGALRRAAGDVLTSFEYLSADALAFVTAGFAELRTPFERPHAHYALVEWSEFGAQQPGESPVEQVLADAITEGWLQDAVLAGSGAQRDAMWRLRESVPAAEKALGGSIKHDISVRIGDVPAFVERARRAIASRWPSARISVYGHVGDGNVHFNVLAPADADAAAFRAAHGDAVSAVLHDLAHAMGGSFSAEHGVGALKRGLLEDYASPTRLDLMRALKRTLDPLGLMNPGKVVGDGPR